MSIQRKRSDINERISLANERKLWVEEDRRIYKMERDADIAFAKKQKSFYADNKTVNF